MCALNIQPRLIHVAVSMSLPGRYWQTGSLEGHYQKIEYKSSCNINMDHKHWLSCHRRGCDRTWHDMTQHCSHVVVTVGGAILVSLAWWWRWWRPPSLGTNGSYHIILSMTWYLMGHTSSWHDTIPAYSDMTWHDMTCNNSLAHNAHDIPKQIANPIIAMMQMQQLEHHWSIHHWTFVMTKSTINHVMHHVDGHGMRKKYRITDSQSKKARISSASHDQQQQHQQQHHLHSRISYQKSWRSCNRTCTSIFPCHPLYPINISISNSLNKWLLV